MDVQTIKVVRQTVNGDQPVYIGVERDNNVRQITFEGVPVLGDAQLVSLYWTLDDGSVDDATELVLSEAGYIWTIGNNLTQYGGQPVSAYLTVTLGEMSWQTKKFSLQIADLTRAADDTSVFSPTLYGQSLVAIQEHNVAMDQHDTDMTAVLEATDGLRLATEQIKIEAVGARDAARGYADATAADRLVVDADKATTAGYKTAAETAAYNAGVDAGRALAQADIASQALSDLIAMLGSQVATLGTDGKLTPNQIPPISINNTYPVASTDEMLLLVAERGDAAVVVVDTVVVDSYLLMTDDPTVLTNWIKLGVSYVANAGHANTADSATDSQMINGKRIIGMTDSQYLIAEAAGTLDDDTWYVTVPD